MHNKFYRGMHEGNVLKGGIGECGFFFIVTSTKGEGSLRKAGMGGDLRVSSDVCGLK